MIEFALVYMIGTVVVNQSQTFDNVNDCLYFARKLNNNQRFHTQMTRTERSQRIVSPCQNVCKIENDVCIGCFRTL